jgi:hypothetical protein
MGQKVITIMIDDMEGTEIVEGGDTVKFALDGVSYEIDLNDKNAAKLRETLRPFTTSARRQGGRPQVSTRGGRSTGPDRAQLEAIRRWARDNGYAVNDRGRIKSSIVEAFEAAH